MARKLRGDGALGVVTLKPNGAKERNKMKKLMMAAAIVCAAVAANAATYNWDSTGVFYWGNDSATGEELAGASIYLFDGNAGFTTASILSSLSTSTDILDSALGYGAVNELAEFSFNGTGIGDDGASPAYVNAILVAVTEDGKFATAMDADPIKVTDAIVANGVSLTPDWAVENLPAAGAAGWTAVAAPEPTSGLLLLIGVAGLALRRRRA